MTAAALGAAIASPAEAAGPVHLRYAVYVHGFRAMAADATLQFDGAHYAVTVADHAVGLVGALISTHTQSRAEGALDAPGARPGSYTSAGYSRGADRRTAIDWTDGQPVVRVLTPVEAQRELVPAAESAGAIDPLSAFAAVVADTAATGRCDARLRVFDGARLTDFTMRAAGTATLPDSDRSRYGGTALRCDFSTREIAGFLHDDNFARAHDPQGGTAWVGRVGAGVPPVPIRAEFSTLDHGVVQAYLVGEEEPGALPGDPAKGGSP